MKTLDLGIVVFIVMVLESVKGVRKGSVGDRGMGIYVGQRRWSLLKTDAILKYINLSVS